jgi:ATP-dependent RNA helicase RhlB
MIKKLLKKIFGGAAKKEAPAAETGKHARRGEHAAAEKAQPADGRRHGERKRSEKPAHRPERAAPAAPPQERGGRDAARAEAPPEGAAPKRRRRRGGRGRARGGAGAPAVEPGGAQAPEAAEGAPAAPATEEVGQRSGQAREGGRRRSRRGGRRRTGGGAPGQDAPGGEAEAGTGAATGESADGEIRESAGEETRGETHEDASRDEEGPQAREGGRRGGGRRGERAEAELAPIALPDLPPIPPWTPPADPGLFANYDLPAAVREGIADAGFTECTSVQAKVLPLALQGKDIAAQSQTGTGKTAAFLVTIYTRLLQRGPVNGPKPRALVIAPTRELAVQIESDAQLLGSHTGLTSAAVFGGVDYDKQRRALQAGADLVIGTPGRLIDYLKQGAWRPEGVELLVIDEADRMLDMGFIRDLRFILRRLPHFDRRQSMLFSATMSWNVMELTYEYMNIPAEIRATPAKMTAEKAVEELYHVARDEKPALLLGILEREKPERTMIFTNTKVEAEKVGKLLEHHGLRARAITGNLEQARRLKLMEEFKAGELPIMVATDVASRGLHIEAVSHVVNWDLPQDPEDYVHRIGRTARAGAAGKAISLADESGALNLEAIEKLIGYKIPVIWHESEHLGEVKPGWREAAARERRERERERDEREGRSRVRHGEAPRGEGRRGGGRGRPGGGRGRR